MSEFLIESSICLACFYGFYWLFLKGEKLLSLNRYYLLITVLASLLIPLLSFESPLALPFAIEVFTAKSNGTAQLQAIDSSVTAYQFISMESIYWLGLAISVGLLLVKLYLVKRKVGKWLSFQNNHIEIVEIAGNDAYSFFSTIFIGEELNQNRNLKDQIIQHELAHIEGRHTVDLLLFELLKCAYWFNPFSYCYAKSIRIQHEYIADNYALQRSDPKCYERSLVQFTLSKVNSSLISSFGEHPIQKRLKMIHKLNSNVMNKLKPLLALPILGLLFIAYACTDVAEPILVDEIQEAVVDLDTEVRPRVIEAFGPVHILDNEIIFEEEIKVPLNVIETETIKARFRLKEGPNNVKKTVEGNVITEMLITEDVEIIEIPDDAKVITEKPVITVKRVKRSNN
ncbi:MAG: beta-lactamase regulating signal transducer with metallopeptidase domain [Candidatus Endobugula sp.]|jgi:beta-lactamase regulating signal transducer with metallopeptidase domain